MPAGEFQVLLSSHNGATLIAEQLDSLRGQTLAQSLRVTVRDDGSSDDTVAVVRQRELGGLNIVVEPGYNVGVKASFRELMRLADERFTYFFLCDQDDVWDLEKVEAAVTALEAAGAAEASIPVLYCGRSIVTREDLTPIGPTDDAPRGPSFANALVQNIAPGHTMAMNRALLRLARDTMVPEHVVMHDCWLYLLATALGRVIFDPVPHAKYRLHGSNDTGYQVGRLGRALGALHRLFTLDRGQWTRQARELSEQLGDRLRPADQAMLSQFLDQRRLASRWAYLRRYGVVYQLKAHPVAASLLFLLGSYRDDRPSTRHGANA